MTVVTNELRSYRVEYAAKGMANRKNNGTGGLGGALV